MDKRVRLIEDAVLEIKSLITFIKEFMDTTKQDVAMLKKHDVEFTTAMHLSCEAKTEEIKRTVDEELDKALKPVHEKATANRQALYGLFVLFVGSLAWLTLQDSMLRDENSASDLVIHERINKIATDTAKEEGSTEATLKLILDEIKYIKGKVDG